MRSELELYIHIPFCVKKCAYCDFLSGPASTGRIDEYVQALAAEVHSYKNMAEKYEVSTIFLGGGTPSILSGEQTRFIMNVVNEVFTIRKEAEVTIEANPGTVTKEKLKEYKGAGINRISFGLQSANNDELRMLGRIHTFEQFLESYELARKEGFSNINVDLISAIPKQTPESWAMSLQRVIDLNPEHISAYSLIVEEGTPFALMYGEGGTEEKELPSEEEERYMYQRTEEMLDKAGYCHYEISNYAKKGYECRHNIGYWERKEYLGLGLGASSFLKVKESDVSPGGTMDVRFNNTSIMEEYLAEGDKPDAIRRNIEQLTIHEQMEEFIFLGLRKIEGISESDFCRQFGADIRECYGKNIEKVIERGLLQRDKGRLKLTEKGIDVSNYVFGEILFNNIRQI